MTTISHLSAYALVALTFTCAASNSSNHDSAVTIYHSTLDNLKKHHSLSTARESFERCIKLDPNYPNPYYNLAITEARLEHIALAVWNMSEYRRISRKPESDKSMSYLKAFQAKQISLFNEQVRATSEALKNNQPTAAINSAKLAIEIAPERYEANALCALAYLHLKNYEKATLYLSKANKLAPQEKKQSLQSALQTTMALAGKEYLKKQSYSKAADYLIASWKVAPEKANVGLAAVSAAMLAGEPKTARSIAEVISNDSQKDRAKQSDELKKKIAELEDIKHKL